MNTAPIPSDVSRIDGSTLTAYEPSTGSNVRRIIPMIVTIIPAAAIGLTPTRVANCDARPADTMIPPGNGRNGGPAFRGPKAEHLLDVKRVEEEHREQARRDQEH